MPPAVFEPTISAGERPQTYALDSAATGTGSFLTYIAITLLITLGTRQKFYTYRFSYLVSIYQVKGTTL